MAIYSIYLYQLAIVNGVYVIFEMAVPLNQRLSGAVVNKH